jgi:hypothetical protein
MNPSAGNRVPAKRRATARGPRVRWRSSQRAAKAAAAAAGKRYWAGVAGIDHPSRVDEGQVGRPRQLPEVEPEGPARHEEPSGDAEPVGRAARSHVGPFHPCRHCPCSRAQDEPRREGEHVASEGKSAPLPPQDHKERSGECCGDALAKEGDDEEGDAQRVHARPAALVEPQVRKPRREEEDGGQRVLLLGNPSH